MKHAIVLSASLSFFTFAPCFGFEYSVPCEVLTNVYPATQITGARQDGTSRFVFVTVNWNTLPISLGSADYGMEFKTYQYNYDEAAAKGKGPAYVTAPGGYFRCDVPGCYLDSDFASERNSVGEYNEPEIAFGIAPEYGSTIQTNVDYYMVTRATSGRGNRSLLKARNYVTKRVLQAVGVSGIFLCGNVQHQDVITFQDRIFSPNCVRTQLSTRQHQSCL